MRDRLRLASAYALIGAGFAVLTFPSFEGHVFNEVRKRTDVGLFALLAVLLAALLGLYGYVSQPRVASGDPGAGRRALLATLAVAGVITTLFFLVPLYPGRDAAEDLAAIALAAFGLFLAVHATGRAARRATSEDTLVARADRRAMFRNALAVTTVPFIVRWPNRPFTLATFGTHWPIWVPFATSATIAIILTLDAVDLLRARMLSRQTNTYRDVDDPIGEPRARLRTNTLASFGAWVVTLGVVAFDVMASR